MNRASRLVLILLACVSVAQALGKTRIEGVVTDPKGSPVTKARVLIKDTAGVIVARTETDSSGKFVFNDPKPGRYTIDVEAEGLELTEPLGLQVELDRVARVAVRLELAKLTEHVLVSSTDPIYAQLRAVRLDARGYSVKDFQLRRDQAVITFKEGVFYFLPAIEGRVTGGVFVGAGEFQLTPLLDIERKHLSILTGSGTMTEQFSRMALRFTDSTYDEVMAVATQTATSNVEAAQNVLSDYRKLMRRGRAFSQPNIAGEFLQKNVDARILLDLLSKGRSGYFTAFFDGKRFGQTLYGIDPLGFPFVAPEEVVLVNFSEENLGVWVSSHLFEHYRSMQVFDETHQLIDIEHQQIEATLKGKRLDAVARTRFKPLTTGLRVVYFDLYPTLRMYRISDLQGRELRFIQEKKGDDSELYVILAEPTRVGESTTLIFEYGGNDAVLDSGGGNFTLGAGARANWYPNATFGDRATYEMTFRMPKDLVMVATGQLLSEVREGEQVVSRWKSDVPLAVAGFNFGRFKKNMVKDTKLNYDIESYANKELPNDLKALQQAVEQAESEGVSTAMTLGSLNTVSMMDKARAEAQLAMSIYSEMFGALPYGRIAMSQQPYAGFGQSWPMLVYMPLLAYLDSTYKQQLGIRADNSFWKIVGPHEVAHQWWGHIVGWKSYRDQWMSEGFSDFSASMFAQMVYKDDTFLKFWREQRELILDREGKRSWQVGGVYMGYRLDTAKTGSVARRVIYPKGAFILHMLRMMMWDPATGDQKFLEMMRDFVKTHYNKNVSTIDFQRTVERHITPQMDLDGNKKMNWFFSQWVYGTSIPTYKLDYKLETDEDGKTKLVGRVYQSEVSDGFKMPVPIYLDFDGQIRRLGTINVYGNNGSEEFVILLPKRPKRVMICYYEDILCNTTAR